MNANEVRIGNYYNQFGNIHQIDWVDIKDLSYAPDSRLWCKPIPLTEEWLLKFGFETQPRKNDLDQWFYIEKGKFSMNNARGFWSHSPIYLEDVIEILYVHTLQNLYFALTGEELEVKQ